MAALEQPVGYVLMENDNTFSEVKNLTPLHNGFLTYVRFDTILQSLDCVNRNRRYYKASAIIESLSDPKITELIKNNKFKGEAGHPVGQPLQRICVVQPLNTCHRIIRWWIDGNLVRGTVETLDDGEGCPGTKLTRAILQDENPSFSYRGVAPVIKRANISRIETKPTTVAYDEVNLPSHLEAYADETKNIVQKDLSGESHQTEMKTKFVSESTSLFEDASIAIYGKDIADMIAKGSDNVKSVCESLDLDPTSIAMYGKNGNVVIHNGSDKILVTPERDVVRKISNMWKGF